MVLPHDGPLVKIDRFNKFNKLNEENFVSLLKLNFTKGIGYHKANKLLIKYSPLRLAQATYHELLLLGFTESQAKSFQSLDNQVIDNVLEWQEKEDQWVITRYDPSFPELLTLISAAPLLLFVKGDPELLRKPQIAIVGSRHASHYGEENAYQFATELSQDSYVITSGLALGIDTSAHQGALAAQGKTIAVLGSGLSCIYPRQNKKLAQQISEQGALVSEFLPHVSPKASHFPQRNRIVSGLALGTLVVEASCRSGSLITARYALEQGREVFAIPGSIHSEITQGCHELIRSGAKLVATKEDICNELSSLNETLVQQEFDFQLQQISEETSVSYYERECYRRDVISAAYKKRKQESHNKKINNHNMLIQNELQNEQLSDSAIAQERFPCDTSIGCGLLLQFIEWQATPIDLIVSLSQQPIAQVMKDLLELELKGFIISVSGGYMKVRGTKK